MKKICLLIVLSVLLFAGCALNEKGYGSRGRLPAELDTVQTVPAQAASDVATQQLIKTNDALLVWLQKNVQTTAQPQQPQVMKLTAKDLGDTKPSPPAKKVEMKYYGYNAFEERLKRVEIVVDNYYPGKKYKTLKRKSGQATLSTATTDYLAEKALQYNKGLIRITGINSYYLSKNKTGNSGLTSKDYAKNYLDEVRNYLKSKGIELPNERCKVIPGNEINAYLLFDEIKDEQPDKKNQATAPATAK
jgi:hypothetical protein